MSKYFAFISYSHRDERWAKWLHKKLETYRPPRRLVGRKTSFGTVPARIPPVFRDRDELASAVDLGIRPPGRDLLTRGGPLTLGERGDQGVQADGPGGSGVLPDRRR